MNRWQKTLAFVLAASAMAWCIHANVVTRFGDEGGWPLSQFDINNFSDRSRLRRANGWPRDVWVRLNWAKSQGGRVVAIEGMHPQESRFDNTNLLVNGAVVVSIGFSVYALLMFVFQRQMSLRGLLALVACSALLIAFVGPYVKTQIEVWRLNKALLEYNSDSDTTFNIDTASQ